ncbi:MAG: methionine--tRNA ligase [Patescibacteria group bacterium]|nr:methionine--tRNA ligase [Patescibacteria group bacterium]
MKSFYITTTLPYVNAEPHIGFAMEIIQADTLARYYSLRGFEVFFNTGTDEHGLKIYRKAGEKGMSVQEYCDYYAKRFSELKDKLNLSYNHFIRTTDSRHIMAAQAFWKRCEANGDIYKKDYSVKYCVGCEMEKTDSELVNGRCPVHPNLELEIIQEENYFFRWSRYQQPLLDLYAKNPEFVRPASKLAEIRNFVESGLQDFSISRLRSKMPWGVPVPEDHEHVMYVWFDALVNYISTIGWPEDQAAFERWWPGFQVAGKDNLRQQSAMWQAMLMSAGLPPSKGIYIHGFITVDGQKMSKSLGNVVHPFDIVSTFGTDAVRYYLLREIPSLDDGDFSLSRMNDIYESDLANELGNLVTRITNLAEKDGLTLTEESNGLWEQSLPPGFSGPDGTGAIEAFQFNTALETLWREVKSLNKGVNDYEPWRKSREERSDFLQEYLRRVGAVGRALMPFLPATGATIAASCSGTIRKCPPLFPKVRRESL